MSHTGLTDVQLQEVYNGERGEAFDRLILSLLRKGKLSTAMTKKVYDKELFSQMFTHRSVNEQLNYEFHEFLGDLVVNKSIGQYLSRRFPQLRCPEGVRVITRLKINLVSKKVLAEVAESLGFWDFISATMEYRMTKKKPMMEDCFEAIMGMIEQQIDEKCCKLDKSGRVTSGGGYKVCYNIIQTILDTYPICGGLPGADGVQAGLLDYLLLVDPKTRLKELFDSRKTELGKVKYRSERDGRLCHTTVFAENGQSSRGMRFSQPMQLGTGTAALQADSQQAAAKMGLTFLKKQGITKAMPPFYQKFCKRV